ncbi:hypothetical protein [Maridesulfovibrio sp.]|uniref:hypothetical protein n=1 Tax=Maridesulfovibrio sp. TaxID=2795000 RepID=UPI0029CA4E8F|nr:hypothetical protein [Maridesulfovibrio sp.]
MCNDPTPAQSDKNKDNKYFEQYQDDLGTILKTAYDEHSMLAVHYRRHQYNLIKTYLWIASATLAAQISSYYKLVCSDIKIMEESIKLDFGFIVFAFYSILFSILSFIFGVWALKGQGTQSLPIKNFCTLMQKSHNLYTNKKKDPIEPQMIKCIHDSIAKSIAQIHEKGSRCRVIAEFLILSIILTLSALLWVVTPTVIRVLNI